ncbi:unnamed protein product, partial [Mortierella alpina]
TADQQSSSQQDFGAHSRGNYQQPLDLPLTLNSGARALLFYKILRTFLELS